MTRRTHLMPTTLLIAVAMIAVTCAAADEIAETAEPSNVEAPKIRRWHLRIGALVAGSNGGSLAMVEPGHVSAGVDAGGGGRISLERRVSPLIGVEFGLAATGLAIDVSAGAGAKNAFTSTDALVMTPVTLGANFHFVNDGPIDVYAGPLLTYNRFSKLSVRTGVDFPWWPFGDEDWTTTTIWWTGSSELSWGAHAGLDVFFGKKKKWSAQFALTYLDATYKAEREPDPVMTSVSLDPLMFGFGFGLRF